MLLALLAQTPTVTSTPRSGGAGSILIFLPFIALMYFFMIRPQRKLRQQQAALLRSLEVGDEIETVAGMFGRISRMDDTTVWVELAPGMTIRMSRGAVRRKVVETPPPNENAN